MVEYDKRLFESLKDAFKTWLAQEGITMTLSARNVILWSALYGVIANGSCAQNQDQDQDQNQEAA